MSNTNISSTRFAPELVALLQRLDLQLAVVELHERGAELRKLTAIQVECKRQLGIAARIRRDYNAGTIGAPEAGRQLERAQADHERSMAAITRRRRQESRVIPRERPKPTRPAATSTRPRGARREHQVRAAKASGGQDPGDSDPDPVEQRIRELADAAPPFSDGQRQRLAQLLGRAR